MFDTNLRYPADKSIISDSRFRFKREKGRYRDILHLNNYIFSRNEDHRMAMRFGSERNFFGPNLLEPTENRPGLRYGTICVCK
ncbi:hypothetical protein DWW79_01845 [Alistipes sp. AF17-16]|nr:hypothetical protein DWW79_01845 [Alistipes sp. AF17-16]